MNQTKPADFDYTSTHFGYIARLIDRVISGEVKRARIHMPPRHGKTESVTKALALWYLKHRPGCRILITGHNMRFARKLSRAVRNRAVELGIPLADDKFSSDEWYTVDGSMVMAAGVGNVPTGEGFDLIIVDDPIRDRKQADSLVFRDSLWDWWTEGLMTRLQPNGVVVGIWTLWHEDDPAGRMDELAATEPNADQFEVLKLAAIAMANDPIGRRIGEALWPAMWNIVRLINRRASMIRKDGLRAWNALYQQEPAPREGALFKPAMLRYIDASEVPNIAPVVRRWDFAASHGTGDFSTGLRIRGTPGEKLYIDDIVRGQWASEDKWDVVLATARRDGPGVVQVIPQDPGSAGKDVVASVVKLLAGFIVAWYKESGSKEARAEIVSPQVNIGMVHVTRAHWNSEFADELRTFPNGRHDDQVDALSGAYQELLKREKKGMSGISWPGDE